MMQMAASNCYWITPDILVGGLIVDSSDWAKIAALGPSAVINVANDVGSDAGKGMAHLLERGQPDDGSPRDAHMVTDYVSWAKLRLAEGRKIYVHCAAGCCRAPSAAYAILRGTLGMTREQALDAVRKGQPDHRRCGGHLFGETSQTAAYVTSIDAALEGDGHGK